MKKTINSFLMVLATAGLVCAAPLEWWDMNDAAGTQLNALSNSGTLGSIWNFSTPTGATDGAGLYVFYGNSGSMTRKLPNDADNKYDTPITTGTYSLDVNFASWSLDAGTVNDLWKLKVQDSAGVDIAGIELGKDSASSARIRMWTKALGGTYYRSYAYGMTQSSAVSVQIVFDFDNDTVAYVIDGVEQASWTDFSAADMAGMVFTTSGSWTTSGSNLRIDSMGINIPSSGPTPADLQSVTNIVNDASGDGLADIGETNTVRVVIGNSGGETATNVQTGVSIASNPSYFTIITNSPAADLDAGSQLTNLVAVIPTASAVPGTYTFDVHTTADGGYSVSNTFEITVAASQPVLENTTNLVADASGDGKAIPDETNTVRVIFRNTGVETASNAVAGVSTAAPAGYFVITTNSVPANLAGGAQTTNLFAVIATASAVPGTYSFTTDLSADNAATTNGTFSITVVEAQAVLANPANLTAHSEVMAGETNSVQVVAENSGNITASNTVVTVTAVTNNEYFVISGPSAPADLSAAESATNLFTVAVLPDTPGGTYSFNVNIAADGGIGTNGTFSFNVTEPPSGIWIVSQAGQGWNVVSGTLSTSVYSNVAVEKGDTVVLAAPTNKKGSLMPLSPLVLGGTASVGSFTVLHNGLDTYPTAWGWYCTVTESGTLDLGVKTDNTAGVTAMSACFVLRSDSRVIELADLDIWDDISNGNEGPAYALNYSFTNALTDGVLVEVVNTRTDLITEPAAYTEVINGGPDKRLVCSFDGVAGSSWTSDYSLSGGTPDTQTSGALGLIFQRGEPVPPQLMNPANLVSDTTGDGNAFIGETNTVRVSVLNEGTVTATNVTVGVSAASYPSYFTIITNDGPANLAWGVQATNTFSVIANTNAAPGIYSFNVSVTATGGYSTSGTFSITVINGVSVSGQDSQNTFKLLAPDLGTVVTNQTMIVSNATFAPVSCTFADPASWLLDIAPVTVAPRSAANVPIVADSTGLSGFGAYTAALTVGYSQPVPAYTNFTVLFNVGAHVSVSGYAITNEVNNGYIAGTYEPEDVVDLVVTNVNDGGVSVSNLVTSLSATSPYFAITPISAVQFLQLPSAAVTTATYRVTIASGTPEGGYAFTVTNRGTYNGQSLTWVDNDTVKIFVVNHADPSVSPSSVTLTAKQGLTDSSGVIVTNAGNAPFSFTVSDNAVWDTSYAVAPGTAPLISTSGSTEITLLSPDPSNKFITPETEGISASLPIGFSFPFYGTNYSRFYVTADGVIGLGNTTNTPAVGNGDGSLPDGGDVPLIAPFWGSLSSPAGSIRYKLSPNSDYLAITCLGVKQVSYSGGTNLQFQTLLYKTGAIEFRYGNINGNWLSAVSEGIQSGTNEYMNLDITPASGTSVLLTRQINSWVTYSPSRATVAPFSSTSVVFTANAAGRQSGDSNNFDAEFVWSGGGTGLVVVSANVVDALPVYSAISSLSFTGAAGQVSSAPFIITNSGDASLTFSISDSAAATAGVSATNLPYNWIEISSIGTSITNLIDPDPNQFITAADEGTSELLPIGFSFPFFGGNYTQFAVSANGAIRLDGQTGRVRVFDSLASTNAAMPAQMIAPYWGDLVIDHGATLKYHSDGTRLVVTWENVRQYGLQGGSNLTFQAVLESDGAITFQYKQLDGYPWPRTLIGLRDTAARTVQADIRRPGDATTGTYLYSGVVYTQYVDRITERTAAFQSAQIRIISVSPATNTIPAHSSAKITVNGNASNLSAGGANSITTNVIFTVTHNASGSPASLAVAFTATNSQQTAFASVATTADSDGDGLTDDSERIAGTDPQNSESVLVLQTDDGRNLSWTAADGRVYTVWYTVSLSKPFQVLAEGITGGSYTDTFNIGEPVVFYKITVDSL